eukprot:TRINITY_DN37405_c0_g1_i1.p2 TRINITY_DN37405_c0_g1~~TRINITY_DN37405_c0_g1_i1.p2  ORF type:complete len:174 (-),score=32.06 TRINITY_DN37405_c0_g1_i1:25-546(-)
MAPVAESQQDQLLTRVAVEELLHKYACAVDRRDWAKYRECFTEDAFIDYTAAGGTKGSLDHVVKWFPKAFFWLGSMQHLVGNVELLGYDGPNKLRVRAMFHNPICVWWFPFVRPFFSVGGWYNHILRRGADGQWRSEYLAEEIAYNQVYGAVLGLLGFLTGAAFGVRHMLRNR